MSPIKSPPMHEADKFPIPLFQGISSNRTDEEKQKRIAR